MNTVLATGRFPLCEGFLAWRAWVNANPDLAVGRLMRRACPHLSEAEAAPYDAPFPSAEFKAGPRRFPNLVCDHAEADGAEVSRRAARWWQREWRGRSFMAIGMQDVVIPPAAMHWLRQVTHGCPDPLELPEAGHFVQEQGEVVARAALEALVEAEIDVARAALPDGREHADVPERDGERLMPAGCDGCGQCTSSPGSKGATLHDSIYPG